MGELLYKGSAINGGPNEAKYVKYDNTDSGLSSKTVQKAVDELASKKISWITSEIPTSPAVGDVWIE